MTIRIPIGPAANLFSDGAADLAPVPAERIVHFADTPVEFLPGENQIRLQATNNSEARPKPVPGRTYH
jgi:hypothetical protein